MGGLSSRDQSVQSLERELDQGVRTGATMELGFAVQNELNKIEGREKTVVEIAIQEVVTAAFKALAQK